MHCPNCNTFADPGTVFCGQCGFRLSGSYGSVALQRKPQWQRHSVTSPDVEQSAFPRTPSPLGNRQAMPFKIEAQPSAHASGPQQEIDLPRTRPEADKESYSIISRNMTFVVIMLTLLLLGIIAGLFAVWQNTHVVHYNADTMNIFLTAAVRHFPSSSALS